jgi:hypothetical protein
MLEELCTLIPPSLMAKSGAVFNSGRAAFAGIAPLYVLGLNPGGDPATHQHETVRSHMDAVMAKPATWSAFRDDSWKGRRPGSTSMQPRVVHLIRRLGMEPHAVPTSNLVFERTRNADDLHERLDQLAEACWPVHKVVIERLRVRTILCMGKDCGEWVRNRLKAHRLVGEFVEQNNRRWRSTAHAAPGGLTVVTATHPAIASWVHQATDPTPLVMEALRS